MKCINEIEKRGLSEVGIYRVPGYETLLFTQCGGQHHFVIQETKSQLLVGTNLVVVKMADWWCCCTINVDMGSNPGPALGLSFINI